MSISSRLDEEILIHIEIVFHNVKERNVLVSTRLIFKDNVERNAVDVYCVLRFSYARETGRLQSQVQTEPGRDGHGAAWQ